MSLLQSLHIVCLFEQCSCICVKKSHGSNLSFYLFIYFLKVPADDKGSCLLSLLKCVHISLGQRYSVLPLLSVFLAAEPEHELFLVYGKGRPGVIRGMDMNTKVPDEYMIPIENLMNPRALDFHAESEFIYFADATSYIIGRQKIDGTERDTIVKEGRVLTA